MLQLLRLISVNVTVLMLGLCLVEAIRAQEQGLQERSAEQQGRQEGGAQESAEDFSFFETHIRPVLVEQCYQCHSVAEGKNEGGLTLDSAPAMQRGGDSGPAVVAGRPDESLLLSALRYESYEMPPSGKLPKETIDLFQQWIDRGAADPRTGEDSAWPNESGLDQEQARQFWAFQPIGETDIPEGDSTWSRNALDRFISAGHLEAGLSPTRETDRSSWLRRVSFNLLGLPPTIDELEEFLRDESPDAYERVVDRLLASPHYGERWGRYWLDLARYADSNGADENHYYPVAWRFRDWVIDAFNRDKPFDQMVIEQLAGDLLPAQDETTQRELLTATGFLVLGPKMLAEQDKPKMVADIVDEQLDTVGKVFLGLTLGCARCHDHKFDPVTAEDYYALAGVFHSTKTMENLDFVSQWNERDLPDAARAQQIAEHQAKIDAARQRLEQLKSQQSLESQREAPSEPDQQAQVDQQARVDQQAQVDQQAPVDQQDVPSEGGDQPDAQENALARQLAQQVEEAEQTVKTLEEQLPRRDRVMAAEDDRVKLVAVHVRGNHLQMVGDPLPRRVPHVLSFGDEPSIEFPSEYSGRLELARWLVGQAAPLTARVMVNRVWQGHFGEGLVRTPSNFGFQGQPPTHPELLEWLANEFIQHGWSLKHLHRQIVLSSTYRLSSSAGNEMEQRDPENRLWLRQNRRRLEIEPLRDALLAVSGELDRALHGELQAARYGDQYASHQLPRTPLGAGRRTIYLPINRAALDDVLATFDYVDPAVSLEKRPSTTVPHQVLFLQNHPLPMHAAWQLARNLLDSHEQTSDRIQTAYRSLLARSASKPELLLGQRFIESQFDDAGEKTGEQETKELEAWASYCRALLLTNEFLFID